MPRLRSQDGQTSAEYVGVLLVVSLIVAALAASGLGGDVVGSIRHLVDCTAGGCATAPSGDDPSAGDRPLGLRDDPAPPTPTLPQPEPGAEPVPAQQPAETSTAPGAVPTPGPVVAASVPWTGPAANLPQSGSRVFVPRKKDRGKPQRVPLGDRGGKKGYVDDDGNKWEWVPEGSGAAHGGAHWDVQHPDGSHTNVFPDGNVVGEDNFPNKPRGSDSEQPGDTANSSSVDPGTVAGVAAGGVSAGVVIWWIAKLASPVCGPAAPVCAVVF